jgi:single-strand DNA-binding protein
MAFSLNKIMLIGHLGKDAETRFTTNNNLSITTFSVATTYSYKGKEGNWVQETTWHNIVAYNLSDYYKEILKKGSKVYVEGRISKKDYTDKEGIKRYTCDVILDKIISLDSREGGSKISEETGDIPDIQVDENDDLPF